VSRAPGRLQELLTVSDTNAPSVFLIEPTRETFEAEVIERSRSVPVVIDFWAPWCGPCLRLGPLLEKLAQDYAGKFVLAKIDTEKEPQLAAQFGVRSIPAVFGVRDGKAVDGFLGVQPEATIKAWLDRLLPTPAEQIVAHALELEATDPKTAEARFNSALSFDPDLLAAHLGLARIALGEGRLEDAQARIASLERRGYLEPEAEKLKAELTLRMQAQQAGVVSLESARAALASNPDDLKLKFQLAESLAAAGQYSDALALCLELVERDRKGKIGEQARQTMVAIFQILPPDSELVTENQRQLSFVLMD
jgi:putative thioredoxin